MTDLSALTDRDKILAHITEIQRFHLTDARSGERIEPQSVTGLDIAWLIEQVEALLASREPVKIGGNPTSRGEVFAEWHRCPSCHGLVTVLSALAPDFCPHCGRPLLWT